MITNDKKLVCIIGAEKIYKIALFANSESETTSNVIKEYFKPGSMLLGALVMAMGMTLACGSKNSSHNDSPYNLSPGVATNTPTATQTTPQTPSTPVDTKVVGETVAVSLKDISFDPKVLTITAGTTVIWTNNDFMAHTVTADLGSFASPTMPAGATFKFTFTEAGTFDYYCAFHGAKNGIGMAGQVVVK